MAGDLSGQKQDKQVALIALHGLGHQKQDPYLRLLEQVLRQLGDEWQQVIFEHVDFGDHLPQHQKAYLDKVESQLGWQSMRRFLVGGFGDAACLQVGKGEPGSPYSRLQKQIRNMLDKIYQQAGRPIPVVAVCQAFAGHALSNYVWDAQHKHPRFGIWCQPVQVSPRQEAFQRLQTLNTLITTGCNIPLFVAGYPKVEPFHRPTRDFRWINFLDKHDALAWPLQPLSPAYDKLVEDRFILPEAHSVLELAQRETPLAHEMYWEDRRIARTVVRALRRQIRQQSEPGREPATTATSKKSVKPAKASQSAKSGKTTPAGEV